MGSKESYTPTEEEVDQAWTEAEDQYPDDPEAARDLALFMLSREK